MLNVNGSVMLDQIVWQQIITVAPHTSYTFSGWVASWGNLGGGIIGFDPSPAQLKKSQPFLRWAARVSARVVLPQRGLIEGANSIRTLGGQRAAPGNSLPYSSRR
jgi:hypothetical protein